MVLGVPIFKHSQVQLCLLEQLNICIWLENVLFFFSFQNNPKNLNLIQDGSRPFGIVFKEKETLLLAELHRTELDNWGHSRRRKLSFVTR